MAGSTAPTAAANPAADPTSRLWQAPVFVLGVAALVGVWLAHPLLAHPDPAAAFRRDLGDANKLLEGPDSDPAKAQQLAEEVLAHKEQFPELAGEADFNLGGALMRQAAQTADGARAADLWAEARQRLEAADKETLPEADHPRLQYRLGVVGYYTHDKPESVIARIKTAIDQADDPVQGYTVLTQAYLSLPKPDLEEARAANLKLRNLQQAKEEILAPARLLGGELELRLGHPDQARKVLENLGPQATPDMLARAVRLCARSWQEENHWAEAAALWQKALADGRQNGEALYNLGVCAEHQDQNDVAAHYWEQCVQAGGDEGQAAAAALAELRLKGQDPETALEMLTQVVDKVKPGAEWTNPLLDRDAVVKLFQEAGKTYLESRHFDAAVRLAEPFERVAAPGEAAVLRAKACAEGARARQEEARQATTPETQQPAEGAARDLFRQAATAYAAAAEQAPPTSEPGEYLWLSAHCSWDGQDAEQAAAQLDKVLHLEVAEEQTKQDWYMQRQGEGWFLLGEAQPRAQGRRGRQRRLSRVHQVPDALRLSRPLLSGEGGCGAGRRGRRQAVEVLEQNLTLLYRGPRPGGAGKVAVRAGRTLLQPRQLPQGGGAAAAGAGARPLPGQPGGDARPLPAGGLLPPPCGPGQPERDPRRRHAESRKRSTRSGRNTATI